MKQHTLLGNSTTVPVSSDNKSSNGEIIYPNMASIFHPDEAKLQKLGLSNPQ